MASSGLPAQAKACVHGFLWASKLAVCQPCNAPNFQNPTSMASYGLPAQAKATQGQIHCCFWAVQRSFRQAFAANGHPKATSMVSYGLPAQAKATPRPDPLLFLGGPASRWPGTRSEQASQGHIHGFLWASKLAVCQPENAPNGFPAQAQATPRRDPLLFLGGPACRSLGIRSQRASQGGIPRPHQWLLMGLQRRQKLPQGQIHCFFSAVQRAIGQAFATNRHQASGVQACRAGSCSRHSEGDLMPSDRAVARSLPSFTAMLLRRGEGFCLRAGGAFVSLLAGL